MEQNPNKKRKVIINIILATLLTAAIVLVVSFNIYNDDKPDNNNDDRNIADVVKDNTEKTQGDFEFSNITISSEGASSVVRGTVKNNGVTRTVHLQFRMSNSTTNRLVGTADFSAENFKTGAKQNFEISMVGDYSKADSFEIVIID